MHIAAMVTNISVRGFSWFLIERVHLLSCLLVTGLSPFLQLMLVIQVLLLKEGAAQPKKQHEELHIYNDYNSVLSDAFPILQCINSGCMFFLT